MGSRGHPGATIRPATLADADELARMRWEFRLEVGTRADRTFQAFADDFRAFASEALVDGSAWRAWVAEHDHRLVGCLWVQLVQKVPHPSRARRDRPVAYLTNMYVAPGHRDAGLGRELLDEAFGFARARGVDGIILWPSERSRPFYERAGFGPGPWLWHQLSGD